MVTNKQNIRIINIMRPPNSVGVISLVLAKLALDNLDYIKKTVDATVKERERFAHILKKIKGIQVFPSQANFVMIKIVGKDASEIAKRLFEYGLIVRNLTGHPALKNCLRLTIRKPEENDILQTKLRNIVGN